MKNKDHIIYQNTDNKYWDKFKISQVFNVSGTTTTHPSTLQAGERTPRITCAATNNGLGDLYENDATEKGGVITVDSAAIGYVSYQPYDFIATDHVEKISNVNGSKITFGVGLFLVQSINKATNGKYGYGYKFSQARIGKQKILLPVSSLGQPDYKYMESYIEGIILRREKQYLNFISKRIENLKGIEKPISLKEKKWKEFFIENLLNIRSGVRLTKVSQKKGYIPFIGSTDSNNGITNFIANTNSSIDNNVLGVNYNGSVVESFYHPYKAIFSDDVKRLSLKQIEGNKYIYLFLKAVILQQKVKYQYAYKFNGRRMARQKIILPINLEGEPDYVYMEHYMKYLEYKKLNSYLEFKQKRK